MLGSLILIGPLIYKYKLLKAMNLLSKHYNTGALPNSTSSLPGSYHTPANNGSKAILILIPVFAILVLALVTGAFLSVCRPMLNGPVSVSGGEETEYPPEETLNDLDDMQLYQDSGFIFPDSDTELIDQQLITNLSDGDLTYAINEIYARHGYIFRSDELRWYYEQFDWYKGTVPANDFSVDCFNQIEQQNWNLFVNERNRRTSSND